MGKLRLEEVTWSAQGHRLSELELGLNARLWNDHPLPKEHGAFPTPSPTSQGSGTGIPTKQCSSRTAPSSRGLSVASWDVLQTPAQANRRRASVSSCVIHQSTPLTPKWSSWVLTLNQERQGSNQKLCSSHLPRRAYISPGGIKGGWSFLRLLLPLNRQKQNA